MVKQGEARECLPPALLCLCCAGQYREALTQGWISRCKELAIPVSAAFNLTLTLASQVEVSCLLGWSGSQLLG